MWEEGKEAREQEREQSKQDRSWRKRRELCGGGGERAKRPKGKGNSGRCK